MSSPATSASSSPTSISFPEPCSIVVPLYIYPLRTQIPQVWSPLINAYFPNCAFSESSLKKYPDQHFIVIVNPGSGPGGQPVLPDPQYCRAIPHLRGFNNVTILGYVAATYGKRPIEKALIDVSTYWEWEREGGAEMAMDGIFVDEVDFEGYHGDFFKKIYQTVKEREWRAKPGMTLESHC
jgi:hypothetical protein